MGSKMLPSVVLVVALALLTFASGCSAPSNCPVCGTTSQDGVVIIDVMAVPGAAGPGGNPFNVFDFGIVDPSTRRYYITDRSQNEVAVYNTVQDVPVATIGNGMFTGAICCTFRASNFNPLTGPNGIVVTPAAQGLGDPRFGLLWAGDGDATVKVFNAATGAPVAPTQMPIDASGTAQTITGVVTGVPRDPTMIDQCIRTGAGCGDFRADEMAFDPVDNILLVSNGDPGVPFVTLINTANPTCTSNSCVLHQIFFNGTSTPGPLVPCPASTGVLGALTQTVPCASAPGGQGGVGGSTFNPTTHRFLVANTQNTSNPADGEVTEIDPLTGLVTRSFSLAGLGCQVSGLTMGPSNKNVLVGCENLTGSVVFPPKEIIMDGGTGRIVAIIDNVGGSDQVWFNPGDNRYYTASRDMPGGPVLGVIDAMTNTWLQNVPTGSNAHSVAADPFNNHIFVPLQPAPACRDFSAFGCVAVYARQ